MKLSRILRTSLAFTTLLASSFTSQANEVSPRSELVANYAVETYSTPMVDNLAKLVAFNTEAVQGLTPDTNPEFIGFKEELKRLSKTLGLDFSDHGYVVLIGLGDSSDKLGVITHGDVQPADAKFWQKSPYELDVSSEPGKLIGRGTEDDKGAIVTAMFAMKAIKDKQLKLDKRIELMVYMAEESDWQPLREFLKDFTPADINITIDAEYPVVTAEKGWSQITFSLPEITTDTSLSKQSQLIEFHGGSFASQVPQEASAVISNVNNELLTALKAKAATQMAMTYHFEQSAENLLILANGKSAHSSTPEDGVNAVTHLAELLSIHQWPKSTASQAQLFIAEMVGLGLYAEQFGEIAYKDDFMGHMTLAATVVKQSEQGIDLTLNLRRPKGKDKQLLEQQAQAAIKHWQAQHSAEITNLKTYWGEPMVMEDAPHLSTLLNVFEHFTGIKNPQPVAIGGSTNSKLFPNALSFGPAMPGVEYTGHSEYEFITYEQFMLNLKMYTAAFIELAAK
ncbi:dipeptidase [Shewanella sp. 1CM18E]|uniref:dipeptidase n=1 Tax=Shewanella sp. 1CM18E TaxID=2929169 RepID=UPI00209BB2F7|nr:dipeptidase [Shewanella sp. 1CM18E]MCK8045578.1 dipeptidase [Shewanella sp. 1CM18E]